MEMMIVVALTLILGIVLVALLFIPKQLKKSGSRKNQSNVNSNKEGKLHSKAEVALHNKRTDCWIIIKDKVYDVTSYVEEHPGGDAILVHAGEDSTEGFYGPQHATRVFDMIEDFYIGELKIN
ncbi:cytochrome B5-like protein [Impatiens glandulifera]|uniref:cytochrome B5-like protein n=1 Tax=Impatiens glandulifera TaxID=253017 RepID=UPI001FB0DEEA|nr:cytochrome B5-like protein [Impatiens glandulifera]